jgi:hypothetical protein
MVELIEALPPFRVPWPPLAVHCLVLERGARKESTLEWLDTIACHSRRLQLHQRNSLRYTLVLLSAVPETLNSFSLNPVQESRGCQRARALFSYSAYSFFIWPNVMTLSFFVIFFSKRLCLGQTPF